MFEKTILFVGNYFKSDKSNQNIWFEIPERLKQHGWQTLVTSKKVSKPSRLLDMLWTIFSKRNLYNVALVDVFSGPAFIWAEMSARLLKILKKPFVLNLRGGNLPAFAEAHSGLVTRMLNGASRVISPSAYLQEQLGVYCAHIDVIPNPIDIKDYPYRNRAEGLPNLVWVRAFHDIYNPSLAPKVLSLLMEKWPGVRLTMVGPDKGDGSLERMVAEAQSLGVIDRIKVIGGVPREEVPQFLEAGEIFINTTNIDNTPLSVIEAMACGLPIVTTNVGGIPWLVEDGVDGLLVPPDDPEVMAEAVERILKAPDLAGKLSQNARQIAEGFDWSLVLPKWENLFTKILEYSSE